jgi:ubiquitin-activating enzyme E1
MRLVTLTSLLFCSCIELSHSTWSRRFAPSPRVATQRTSGFTVKSSFPPIRGGETDTTSQESQEDEERYSRQVYSLGARAHGLIRSSTVYLDGSPSSGLLFECAKNLALSGVRKLVIVLSDDSLDNRYHNAELDDLGQSYQRAARSEIRDHNKDTPGHEILVEYLKRLNPSILVSTVDRSSLKEIEEPSRGVLLCVDRPFSTQVALNRLSRELSLAFVAVETAGVFGRVFCDFGPSFEVYDADGETPLVTPLDRVEDKGDGTIVVHCVEGENHDVSKGDTIEFQRRNGSLMEARCIVTDVQNPYRFMARLESEMEETFFLDQVNSDVASLRRVKIPQHLTFEPIESAIELAKSDDSLFTPCDLDKSFDSVRRGASLSSFQALASFIQREDRFPTDDDMDEFWPEAQASWAAANGQGASGEGHCRTFLRGCAAKLTPFQAVFGAIGAQETLKAATGLYYPTRQFLLYDCDEIMAESRPLEDESVSETNPSCDTKGLRHILGHATVEKLQANRVFVVGAGGT